MIALAAVAVIPSTALAAGEKISVSPVGADGTTPALAAGGNPALNLSANFDPKKTPTAASFNLPPGLLLNLGANSSCLIADPGDFSNDEQCDVGSGTIDLNAILDGATISGVTASGSVFLAPPAAGTNDLAVLDIHMTSIQTPLGAQDDVVDAPIHVQYDSGTGGLTLVASDFPASVDTATFGTVGIQILGIKASLDATLNNASGTSEPLFRLPTSCSAATSSMTATYSDGSTGSASGSFTPTGCTGLSFAPSDGSVSVDADSSGNAELALSADLNAGDAGVQSVKFGLPSSVMPSFSALSSGDQIGTVQAGSSFLPGNLNGSVTLGGTAAAPTLQVAFPAPLDVTFTGTVDTADDTVTFSNIPDVGLFNILLDLTGANGTKPFTTNCSGGNATIQFVAWDSQIDTLASPLTFSGCTPPSPQPPPTAEALSVTPSGLTAGASTAVSDNLVFSSAAAGAAQTVQEDLAPGLLADIAANPSCVTGTPQETTACHIGVADVDRILLGNLTPEAADLFLVAPPDPKTQIAGIDVRLDPTGTIPDAVLGVTLDASTGALTLDGGPLPTQLSLGAISFPTQVTDLDLMFDTLNGRAFIRLPSTCVAAQSKFTVDYVDSSGDAAGTGTASGSFTPTGCASEAFAPSLSASVVGKGGPGAAAVKLDSTQKAGEAASKSIKLSFPSGLTGGSGISGTASVSSPLLAKAVSGKVSESGSTVTVAFPAPFGLTLTGTVSGNTITFSGLPDISLSDLSLDLTSGFTTDCSAGSVTGAFSGQGGQSHTATAQLQVSDCTPPSTGGGGGTGTTPTTPTKPTTPTTPTKPTTPTTPTTPRNHVKAPKKAKGSGTVKGLASGHPTVSLKVTLPAGQKAKSLTVALPKGLKFSKAAFAKHKVSGLKLGGGAKAASVKLKAGKLVIALKKPVHSLSIKVSGKLVTASGAVAASKHHKPLTLTVRATTTNHKTDTVKIKLTV